MATLHSRGSYALKGLIVSSTVIDPNYEGFIYASLFNVTSKEIFVKEKDVIIGVAAATNLCACGWEMICCLE